MSKYIYRGDMASLRSTPRLIGNDGKPVERRTARRRSELPLAAEVYALGIAPLPCTLRDRSATGARLEMETRRGGLATAAELPDALSVWLCSDQIESEARIIWRDGRHFGIAFIGKPRRRSA